MKKLLTAVLCFLLLLSLTHCKKSQRFTIISGSENESLEEIVREFGDRENVDIEMVYKGSVDISLELRKETVDFDAVWPASSLWVAMGDTKRRVRHMQSIMRSPVVFGIKKSLAQNLGFTGRDVRVRDILGAIREKKLSFMMTSATQSNSGASAYIGFLYAILGNPEIIESADLRRSDLKDGIRALLSGINRSSGSSGWLRDLYLKKDYDAMVNYEALIIETNQELLRLGREPLYAVYPVDGLTIADSPMGYVNRGDHSKEAVFRKLQAYLLSKEVQQKILEKGRRTGVASGDAVSADRRVFNPEWGIDASRILTPINLPRSEVIAEALDLYQTVFRKPSLTVYCLDFSGSMNGDGIAQLKKAMELVLDQAKAREYMIQASVDDIIIVLPFSSRLFWQDKASGGNKAALAALLDRVMKQEPRGGTDIYSPAIAALRILKSHDLSRYIPAVVLMTDGESNMGLRFQNLESVWKDMGLDVPVFSILFGSASKDQLKMISDATGGKVFDGRKDLTGAFRQVRGYN